MSRQIIATVFFDIDMNFTMDCQITTYMTTIPQAHKHYTIANYNLSLRLLLCPDPFL